MAQILQITSLEKSKSLDLLASCGLARRLPLNCVNCLKILSTSTPAPHKIVEILGHFSNKNGYTHLLSKLYGPTSKQKFKILKLSDKSYPCLLPPTSSLNESREFSTKVWTTMQISSTILLICCGKCILRCSLSWHSWWSLNQLERKNRNSAKNANLPRKRGWRGRSRKDECLLNTYTTTQNTSWIILRFLKL